MRDLVYIGIFGALWGTLVIALGAYLHVIKAPFTGTIMTTLAIEDADDLSAELRQALDKI